MQARSKFLTLAAAALFLAPQVAAARDDFGGTPRPFATPEIEMPDGVVATTHDGRTTFTLSPRPSSSPRSTVEGRQFCNRFNDATGTVSTDLNQKFNELQTQFGARADKIKADFKTVADTQATNRAQTDSDLNAKLGALGDKATTTAQKQAVTDFKAAVLAAVKARRAAVDAANAAFKQGLLDANATRQATLRQAATDYKTAVQAAIAAAKASCTAGTDPATVRTTLKSALDAAKAKLEAARQAAGPVANLDTLKATRKAAVEKANADFKAAIQAALAKLKAALGTSGTATATPAPSTTPTTTP